MIQHCDQKQLEEGRVSFYLQVNLFWRKARAGAEAETTIEECRLGLALGWWPIIFLIQLRATCLGMVPPTVGATLLHELTIKKNVPQAHPQSHLMEAISPVRFSLPGVSSRQLKQTTTTTAIQQYKIQRVQQNGQGCKEVRKA